MILLNTFIIFLHELFYSMISSITGLSKRVQVSVTPGKILAEKISNGDQGQNLSPPPPLRFFLDLSQIFLLILKLIRNDSQKLFFGPPFEILIEFWKKFLEITIFIVNFFLKILVTQPKNCPSNPIGLPTLPSKF